MTSQYALVTVSRVQNVLIYRTFFQQLLLELRVVMTPELSGTRCVNWDEQNRWHASDLWLNKVSVESWGKIVVVEQS